MNNKIDSVKLIPPKVIGGECSIIAIALNACTSDGLRLLVPKAVAVFKSFRTTLPPGEYALLVTIIGEGTAESFAAEWIAASRSDIVLSEYMRGLIDATALLGTADGRILGVANCVAE